MLAKLWRIKGSYSCNCIRGFTLSKNGRDCVDTDECLSNRCEDICTNTIKLRLWDVPDQPTPSEIWWSPCLGASVEWALVWQHAETKSGHNVLAPQFIYMGCGQEVIKIFGQYRRDASVKFSSMSPRKMMS
ncbi:hypothetical protein DPEC_G00311560 [Dallia pectoralis]|uniref:Uncharacterized protein n=1 Tax=Dallia pectoralis TaxID=75939 RepID=A0ACC2FBF7_DALPE|nr:hypothetical protein DPEC_G00311560 [Dallia pectoralis]